MSMKRLNSSEDDNAPIYIFILLFVIFILSFLGTLIDPNKRTLNPARNKP